MIKSFLSGSAEYRFASDSAMAIATIRQILIRKVELSYFAIPKITKSEPIFRLTHLASPNESERSKDYRHCLVFPRLSVASIRNRSPKSRRVLLESRRNSHSGLRDSEIVHARFLATRRTSRDRLA